MIAYSTSLAREGWCWRRDGSMLLLLQDVNILDFSGLMKHPRSAPRRFKLSRKNLISIWGIVQERSSTQAKRCEILPNPSSPASPLLRRFRARC